jgi:capsular polysaccharide biosynthesis protein
MEKTKDKTKEIDVLALCQKAVSKPKMLMICGAVAFVIGIIYALSMKRTYVTTVTMVTESQSVGKSNMLSNVASMAGINLSGAIGGEDAITSDIYPDVLASTSFSLGLLDAKVKEKESDTLTTYKQHLMKGRSSWMSSIVDIFKSGTEKKDVPKKMPYELTKEDGALYAYLTHAIICKIDRKTDVVSVSVSDEDPYVAATVADTILNRLKNYITQYRTAKARADLEYLEKLYKDAKASYSKAQHLYAGYADSNQEIILQSVRLKQDEMENDMQLKYNIYTQYTSQMTMAKAKVQEHTPVFTVIQKPVAAQKPSGVSRSQIVMLFVFVGILAGCLINLFEEKIIELRKKK